MSAFHALLMSFLYWNTFNIYNEVRMKRFPFILTAIQCIGFSILMVGVFAPNLLVRLM